MKRMIWCIVILLISFTFSTFGCGSNSSDQPAVSRAGDSKEAKSSGEKKASEGKMTLEQRVKELEERLDVIQQNTVCVLRECCSKCLGK